MYLTVKKTRRSRLVSNGKTTQKPKPNLLRKKPGFWQWSVC